MDKTLCTVVRTVRLVRHDTTVILLSRRPGTPGTPTSFLQAGAARVEHSTLDHVFPGFRRSLPARSGPGNGPPSGSAGVARALVGPLAAPHRADRSEDHADGHDHEAAQPHVRLDLRGQQDA